MMYYKYFLLFLMYSCVGWCMEVGVSLYQRHKFVNRGFMIGPYCPIYGWGCLFITSFLSKYKSDVFVLFSASIAICSILEYFTSYFMEKIFHARWWDYSNKKFNLNGRICLETMSQFGILACVVVYFVDPCFNTILDKIPYIYLKSIAIVLFIIFLLDFIISFNVISKFKTKFFKLKTDNTEEISQKVKDQVLKFNFLDRRLLNAFPDFELLKKAKEKIIKKQKMLSEQLNKKFKK